MFEKLEGSSGNVFGFRIGERIAENDVRDMSDLLAKGIDEFGKVRLLVEIEGFRRMDPGALSEKLKFAMAHMRDIERMAVVSSRVWIKSWVQVGGMFVPVEVRHFDRSETEAAWEWLRT